MNYINQDKLFNKTNYNYLYALSNENSVASFYRLNQVIYLFRADIWYDNYYLEMKGRIEYQGQVERLAYFENQLTGENKLIRLILCYQPHSNLINLTLSFAISNL